MADLAVQIVSFNTCRLTVECIETALRVCKSFDVEFVVVDNGIDGTAEVVDGLGAGVTTVSPHRNLGFGAGHNLAANVSTAPILLFLNTDAILTTNCVRRALAEFASDPKISLVSPQLVNSDGSIQRTWHSYPSAREQWLVALRLARWVRVPSTEPKFLSGTCLFVRRVAFESIGGFDMDYPMYWEDADLSWRLAALGWKSSLLSDSSVVHATGQSGVKFRRVLTGYSYRGRLRFIGLHRGGIQLPLARLGMRVEGLTGKVVLFFRSLFGNLNAEDRQVIEGITSDLIRLRAPESLPRG